MDRRQFIKAVVGSVAVVGSAGCIGNDDDNGEVGEDTGDADPFEEVEIPEGEFDEIYEEAVEDLDLLAAESYSNLEYPLERGSIGSTRGESIITSDTFDRIYGSLIALNEHELSAEQEQKVNGLESFFDYYWHLYQAYEQLPVITDQLRIGIMYPDPSRAEEQDEVSFEEYIIRGYEEVIDEYDQMISDIETLRTHLSDGIDASATRDWDWLAEESNLTDEDVRRQFESHFGYPVTDMSPEEIYGSREYFFDDEFVDICSQLIDGTEALQTGSEYLLAGIKDSFDADEIIMDNFQTALPYFEDADELFAQIPEREDLGYVNYPILDTLQDRAYWIMFNLEDFIDHDFEDREILDKDLLRHIFRSGSDWLYYDHNS